MIETPLKARRRTTEAGLRKDLRRALASNMRLRRRLLNATDMAEEFWAVLSQLAMRRIVFEVGKPAQIVYTFMAADDGAALVPVGLLVKCAGFVGG